jgi:hypothetical protein
MILPSRTLFFSTAEVAKMANQPPSDIYSGKFSVPFFDFAGLMAATAKQNSKLSTTMQAVGKEWTDFVGARLREDSQLFQTLRECKEFPSVRRACVQFWGKALSQYEEEAQRLMRITQGAMDEAVHVAEERIETINGGARRASNS